MYRVLKMYCYIFIKYTRKALLDLTKVLFGLAFVPTIAIQKLTATQNKAIIHKTRQAQKIWQGIKIPEAVCNVRKNWRHKTGTILLKDFCGAGLNNLSSKQLNKAASNVVIISSEDLDLQGRKILAFSMECNQYLCVLAFLFDSEIKGKEMSNFYCTDFLILEFLINLDKTFIFLSSFYLFSQLI